MTSRRTFLAGLLGLPALPIAAQSQLVSALPAAVSWDSSTRIIGTLGHTDIVTESLSFAGYHSTINGLSPFDEQVFLIDGEAMVEGPLIMLSMDPENPVESSRDPTDPSEAWT